VTIVTDFGHYSRRKRRLWSPVVAENSDDCILLHYRVADFGEYSHHFRRVDRNWRRRKWRPVWTGRKKPTQCTGVKVLAFKHWHIV